MTAGALGRRAVDATDDRYRNLQRLIRDAGGPDEVARLTGRSARTVKNWIHKDPTKRRRPNTTSMEAIARRAAPAANQRAVAKLARGYKARHRTASTAVTKIKVTGHGGVMSHGTLYGRTRAVDAEISGEALADFYAALAKGHTQVARQILSDETARTYGDGVPGWHWDSVDGLNIADDPRHISQADPDDGGGYY